MDLARYKAIVKARKTFREENLKEISNSTWVILRNKYQWDFEVADILLQHLIARLPKIPARTTRQEKQSEILGIDGNLQGPYIEILFNETESPVDPAQDIPLQVQALLPFLESLRRLGLKDALVREEILRNIEVDLPGELIEELRLRDETRSKKDKEAEEEIQEEERREEEERERKKRERAERKKREREEKEQKELEEFEARLKAQHEILEAERKLVEEQLKARIEEADRELRSRYAEGIEKLELRKKELEDKARALEEERREREKQFLEKERKLLELEKKIKKGDKMASATVIYQPKQPSFSGGKQEKFSDFMENFEYWKCQCNFTDADALTALLNCLSGEAKNVYTQARRDNMQIEYKNMVKVLTEYFIPDSTVPALIRKICNTKKKKKETLPQYVTRLTDYLTINSKEEVKQEVLLQLLKTLPEALYFQLHSDKDLSIGNFLTKVKQMLIGAPNESIYKKALFGDDDDSAEEDSDGETMKKKNLDKKWRGQDDSKGDSEKAALLQAIADLTQKVEKVSCNLMQVEGKLKKNEHNFSSGQGNGGQNFPSNTNAGNQQVNQWGSRTFNRGGRGGQRGRGGQNRGRGNGGKTGYYPSKQNQYSQGQGNQNFQRFPPPQNYQPPFAQSWTPQPAPVPQHGQNWATMPTFCQLCNAPGHLAPACYKLKN